MKTIVKSCLITLCLIACNKNIKNQNTIVVNSFKINKNLIGKQILKKNTSSNIRIYVYDSIMLIEKLDETTFYDVYNTNNLKKIGSIGHKGKIPNSWINPVFSGQFIKQNNNIKAWINDGMKDRLMLVNISTLTNKKKSLASFDKKISTPLKEEFKRSLLYVNDSILIGDSGIFDPKISRLKRLNLNTKSTFRVPLFPQVINKELLDPYDLYILYASSLYIEGSHIVSAMKHFDRIDVFNTDLKLNKSIVHNNNSIILNVEKYKKRGNVIDNLKLYNNSLYVSKKYIYTLYINMDENKFWDNGGAVQIRIYNFNGKGVAKLKVKESLTSFSVDEKRGFIYGVDYLNEKIMQYNIKSVLNAL